MSKNKKAHQPKIIFEPGHQEALIRQASSILEVALQNEIDLSHSCGGMGSCTTCRIFVESDAQLPERNELEEEIASSRNFSDRERLACQLEPLDGLVVRIPPKKES